MERHFLALEMPLVAVEAALLGGILQEADVLAKGKKFQHTSQYQEHIGDAMKASEVRKEITRLLRQRLLAAEPGTRVQPLHVVDALLMKDDQPSGWLEFLSMLYDWQAAGRRVYHVDADALARLRETSFTGVTLRNIEVPFSAFVVELPHALFMRQGCECRTVIIAPAPFKEGITMMLLPTPSNADLVQRLSSRQWRSKFCGAVGGGRFREAWMMTRRFEGLDVHMLRMTFSSDMLDCDVDKVLGGEGGRPSSRALNEALCAVAALCMALAAGRNEGIVLDGDKPKGTGTERPARPPVVHDPSTIACAEDVCVVKHEHIVRLSQALARKRSRNAEPAYEVDYHTRKAYKRRRPGESKDVPPSIQVGPPGGVIEVRKDKKSEGQAAPGSVGHIRV